MTDAEATAQAFANIAAALQLLQAAATGAPPPPPQNAPHVPLFDLFDDATPFDMSSRAGSTAMSIASAALGEKWDGSVNKLPTFLLSLKQRAHEVKWDAALPSGILLFDDMGNTKRNLLDFYHSIHPVTIETARAARTDNRAKQNSRAMFSCLSQSIEGDIRSVLFDQDGNLPIHNDGPTLFKRMVDMTAASSLQVSMQAIRQLQDLDPADHQFNLAAINTKATHLFTLATTTARALSDAERTQFLLNAYNRIKQPAAWATWVSNKIEQFDDGHLLPVNNVPVFQALMNSAVHKATKIITSDDTGHWKSTSVEDDVVAMLATAKKPTPLPKPKPSPNTAADSSSKPKLPPFARHFKASPADDAPKFQVGDTKVFEGATWYFCDARHRNNLRWHKFPASECRQRTRDAPPIAAVGDATSTAPSATPTQLSGLTHTTDIAAMLANCYALASDNSLAQDSIASALEALRET